LTIYQHVGILLLNQNNNNQQTGGGAMNEKINIDGIEIGRLDKIGYYSTTNLNSDVDDKTPDVVGNINTIRDRAAEYNRRISSGGLYTKSRYWLIKNNQTLTDRQIRKACYEFGIWD